MPRMRPEMVDLIAADSLVGEEETRDAASAGTRVERRRRGERLQRVEVRVATAYASNKQFSRIVAALDRRAAGNGE